MGIKFQTDQSGANNNVCSSTSQIFNFSLARSSILDSASFSIKKGSGTTETIVVEVYNQSNGSGNIVESVSVLAANVTQTFSNILFTFSGNTTLNAGTSYSLKISSSTSCSGSSPYSIKSGNFQVLDTTTNSVLNTGYGVAADLFCDSIVSSQSNVLYNNSISLSSTTSVSAQVFKINNINTLMLNSISFNSEAIKISNNTNSRKIKLNNLSSIQIYLGNQKRKVYHGNRIIVDK